MAGEVVNKGWISLYRSIQEHWLWQEKPFSKGQAWLDILLSANHQDRKIIFDSNLIEVNRGEYITSIRKLCERWGWSNSKVKKFLDTLQLDGMITYKSDTKKTAINIVNYNIYQPSNIIENITETSQKHHRNITETSQKHTNNNDNNVNNDNKYIYSSDSNEYRLAIYLFNFIKRNNEKAKEPNFQTWAKHMHYILTIDKRDLDEVKQVIKFSQTDSFWYKNILSPDKLRKKYDQLYLQMKNPIKPNGKIDNFNNYEQRQYDYDELEKKLLGWE